MNCKICADADQPPGGEKIFICIASAVVDAYYSATVDVTGDIPGP
jgi:hypothetical protein